MPHIEFDMIVLEEDKVFIAYSPELDISSCGSTIEESKKNLKIAVKLFIEEAEKMGTLDDILLEAGYQKDSKNNWIAPKIISSEVAEVE